MGFRKEVTITDLPRDILYLIFIHVHKEDSNNLQSFAETCREFYSLYHSVSRGGKYAIPIHLKAEEQNVSLDDALSIEDDRQNSGRVTIKKTAVPGGAYIFFNRNLMDMSCSWAVQINKFKGHRIEMGVALSDAFRFEMVERVSSWSFDCFGRACVAGKRMTYGRQILENESITFVYDSHRRYLSVLDKGISMGQIPVVIDKSKAQSLQLFAFIYFPFFTGECVSLLDYSPSNNNLLDLDKMHNSYKMWKRPSDLPCGDHIIVSTWEEHTWYAICMDPHSAPVSELWKELEILHGMQQSSFELIFNGYRLPNCTDKTLSDVGVVIDERTGSCLADILLSVPHIVS